MPVYELPEEADIFPDPSLAEPDGLLAVGGDLSPARLVAAYTRGIFPWYTEDSPILWWSPDPRCVLFPQEFHLPRSLKRTLNKGRFRLTFDTAFASVIQGCAASRNDGAGTWIVPDMVEAYCRLHELGLAHSVEAWEGDELAGGLYGVSLGSAFFGESMFFVTPDASKAALAFLTRQLGGLGYSFIDCQQETDNLLRFGARAVPRSEFIFLLSRALRTPTRQGTWQGLENG